MKTIAILGANGRLSHAVANAFHDASWKVIAVTRNGVAQDLPEAVEHRAADALDEKALIAATSGADVIFNGLNPIYTDWHTKALPMAEAVIAAARHNRSMHLFAGNIYNYGREIPAMVDENTEFVSLTKKGAIRVEMEELFEAAARSHALQTIILRAGDFYGTKKTGSWFDLVVAAKAAKGTITYPGPRDLPHAWAYLPDLARHFVALAEKRAELPVFETYTYAGHTLTGNDLIAHCENALGNKVKRAGMPWILIKAGGLFNGMWREISEMSYLWFRPHQLSSEKLDIVTGSIPTTKPAEAVRQALVDIGQLAETSKGKLAVR